MIGPHDPAPELPLSLSRRPTYGQVSGLHIAGIRHGAGLYRRGHRIPVQGINQTFSFDWNEGMRCIKLLSAKEQSPVLKKIPARLQHLRF